MVSCVDKLYPLKSDVYYLEAITYKISFRINICTITTFLAPGNF